MTNPLVGDGSDVAEQLAALARDLEAVQSLIRTVAWGVDRETGELSNTLAALTDRVDQLAPAPAAQQAPDAPEPKAWVDSATAQQWQDLAGWVDWLAGTYDVLQSRAVLPCWPAHRGVAEELGALRSSWRAAAKAGQTTEPSDAMVFWHDRWLHPCLGRLREAFQQKNCQDKHATPRPGPLTNPDLLAAALEAAPGLDES